MSDARPMISDAIVTYRDAEQWATELYPVSSAELEARLMEFEPAVAAVAIDLANRLYERLRRAGASERAASNIAAHTARAGFVCAELTRRGYRKFNDDPTNEGGAA